MSHETYDPVELDADLDRRLARLLPGAPTDTYVESVRGGVLVQVAASWARGRCPDHPEQTVGPWWDWHDTDGHVVGGRGDRCGACAAHGPGWVTATARLHDGDDPATVAATLDRLAGDLAAGWWAAVEEESRRLHDELYEAAREVDPADVAALEERLEEPAEWRPWRWDTDDPATVRVWAPTPWDPADYVEVEVTR